MQQVQIRPRFKISVPFTAEEVLHRLSQALKKEEARCTGSVLEGYAILNIPPLQRHYWSPRLSIQVEEDDQGAKIRGLFGPRPTVWTLFATFYAFSIFVGLVGLVYGFSQWSLGHNPSGLWLVLVSAVLFGASYGIAFTGQQWSRDQMVTLKSFFEEALGIKLSEEDPS